MKTFGLAFLLFSPSVFAATTNVQGLIINEVTADESLSFDCKLTVNNEVQTHHIDVNKNLQQLAIRLHDGVEIKGAAVSTRVPNLKKTFYYFSNGYEPYHYNFTVSVNDDGSAASFQLAANARTLDCKH